MFLNRLNRCNKFKVVIKAEQVKKLTGVDNPILTAVPSINFRLEVISTID